MYILQVLPFLQSYKAHLTGQISEDIHLTQDMLLFRQYRKSLSQNHSMMILWFTLSPEKPLPESPLHWKTIPHSAPTASIDLPPPEHEVKNSSLRESTETRLSVSNRENSPFSQHQVTSASCIWLDVFWTKHFHMGAPNFSHVQTSSVLLLSLRK